MFFGNHTIFPPSPPEKIAIYLRMSAAGIYVLRPHQLPYNGHWQGNEKISRFIFNKTHTYLRMYKRFCTQAGLKCCRLELRLFLQLPTGVLSISSSLKPCVLSTFVHKIFQIVGKNLGKCWGKVGICNLSIFKPKKPDLLFESRLYHPQTILSTCDKHHPNISRESPFC